MEINQWVEKTRDYVMGTTGQNDTELTSVEISSLWNTYMHYSMLACVFRYFEKVEADESEIQSIMSEAYSICEKRVVRVAEIFKKENLTVPTGFTEKDANPDAPRLFTDSYHLYYLKNMIRFGLTRNSLNLCSATRPDIIDFYEESVDTAIGINRKAANLMLSKGILTRYPYIPISDQKYITRRSSFFGGFMGDKRPLLGEEISYLYFNALINHIGRVLLTGFAQVAKSQKVRHYMIEGMKICDELIEDFTSTLRVDGIPTPLPWDAGVTDSTVAPFSDKLIMNHVSLLSASGVGALRISLASSPRYDLAAMYARIMAKVGKYAVKGAKIMMENGWMEEPPQVYKGEGISKAH